MCCHPKKEGVLGLGNLVSKNIALVAKWLWRFSLELHSLCPSMNPEFGVKLVSQQITMAGLVFLFCATILILIQQI